MSAFEEWAKDKDLKLDWEYWVAGVRRVAKYTTNKPILLVGKGWWCTALIVEEFSDGKFMAYANAGLASG